MNPVMYTKSYSPPIFNKAEILRYARARQGYDIIDDLIDSCINEISDMLTYRVCYCELPLRIDGSLLYIGEKEIASQTMIKKFSECSGVIMLAATVGMATDRLMARYAPIVPSRALIFQAIGTERIESLCDTFENDLKYKGYVLSSRISPGYGDIPMDLQNHIFAVLDCQKKIGLTLNESLLMSPTKSITAFIGIKNRI